MKFDKFTDVFMTGGIRHTVPPVIQTSVNFSFFNLPFLSYFSHLFTPTCNMRKLCMVTKVKVLFLVVVYVFNSNLLILSFWPPFWRKVYAITIVQMTSMVTPSLHVLLV